MCMACVTNGGYAAYEAVVMIGGPSAYTAYRRVRIRLGFGDPAAVPAEQPVAPPAPERPARAPAPVGRPSPASG
jgi:hypothetical protein